MSIAAGGRKEIKTMAEQIKEREEMMSDRLTRLIDGFVFGSQIAVNSIEWNSAKVKELADYLIANGVIVPPCKVGDTIYQTDGVRIYTSIINKVIFVTENIAFDEQAINNSIFLTREEAEKALKEKGEK